MNQRRIEPRLPVFVTDGVDREMAHRIAEAMGSAIYDGRAPGDVLSAIAVDFSYDDEYGGVWTLPGGGTIRHATDSEAGSATQIDRALAGTSEEARRLLGEYLYAQDDSILDDLQCDAAYEHGDLPSEEIARIVEEADGLRAWLADILRT